MNNSESNFTEQLTQQDPEQHFLGRALVKLQVRLESVEAKVTSLTKIVRLLQHYSEKKDLQYEKETHNVERIDEKLSRIDLIQKQLTHTIQRYEELTKHFHCHSLKIDQIIKKNKDTEMTMQAFEQKLAEQTQHLSRKIQGIESTMLKNIREGTHQQRDGITSNNSYILEELNFRMQQLQTQLHNQYARLKLRIDKAAPNNRKSLVGDDTYGLGMEGRKKSKVKNKEREPSIKRLKSR